MWACILTAIILFSSLAAVAPRVAGVPSPIGPQPKVFTTLRIGELQEPDSLNPFIGVLSASYVIWAHTYELLVGIGLQLEPVPAIAQSWEVDSAGYNWTFHLVHNATWQDSTPANPQPVTAEDVNFTFRYIWAQTPWNPIGCDLLMLQSYLGDPTTNTGVDVNNITVLDPYTILIPTFTHKANILSMFIQILPKHIWESISCNQATHVSNNPPIGSGMYKVTNWVRNTYIQLDLNTAYWRLDPNADYIDRIIIRYYSDANLLANAFRAGDIDTTDALPANIYTGIPDRVANSATPNVGKLTVDSIEFTEMGGCLASDALINDYGAKGGRNWLVTNLTVRQAMQISVNRSSLVENVIAGLGRPGSTIIAPATPFWHYNVTAAEEYKFDLDRARQLLNDPKGDGATLKSGQTVPGPYGENLDPSAANNQDAFIDTNGDGIREVVNAAQVVAGDDAGTSAPNSNQLSFSIEVRSYDANGLDVATFMENWWDQVGIHVTTQQVAENRLIGDTYDCSEDLYMWGWGGDVDPDFMLSVMTSAQIGNWQDAWYYNQTYDALYVQQQSQIDPYQRQQTIWEMQRILYHDAAYLIAYYPFALAVVRTDTFTGWGNWTANPGLALTGYGNDFIMLQLRATGSAITNQCPTAPVLEGQFPRNVYANVSTRFTANASDPEGDPLTWIFSWDDGNTTTTSTPSGVTDNQTGYAWETPGTYNVRVTVDDGHCGQLVASSAYEVVVNPLPAQIGWVTGTVSDAETHIPIRGAGVAAVANAGAFSTTTDSLGEYNLTLAPGTFAVAAAQALYAPQTMQNVAVTAGQATVVNFDLATVRGWIAGTVTSSADHSTLQGAVVRVVGARLYTTQTDSTGRYNVTVAPGSYTMNVSRDGYYNQSRTDVNAVSGQTATQDFALDPLPAPTQGLSVLVYVAIGAVVILAVAGVAVLLILRRRKGEEIRGPEAPPPKKPEAP